MSSLDGNLELILAGLVVLIFFLLLLAAFYRLSMEQASLKQSRQQIDFFEKFIKSDPRIPLWVFADDRLECDDRLVSILDMDQKPNVLGDLTGYLPKDILSQLYAFTGTKEQSEKVFVAQHIGQYDIIIEVVPIFDADPDMPNKLIWFSQSKLDNSVVNQQSSALLDHRLKLAIGILDTISIPMWAWDATGKINHVNKAYIKAVDGNSVSVVVDKQIHLFEPKGEGRKERIFRGIHDKNSTVKERQYAIVKGKRRAFVVIHKSAPDERSILSIAIDVTAEEDALSELNRVLESQSVTLNRLASPVAIFGPDHELKFYNQAFQHLTAIDEIELAAGISHNDLLEKMRALRRLPEQADFKEWKASILKRYTGLLEPVEEIWHQPDGTTHRVLTQPHPLGGLLLLFEDMTDRLALERSVNTLTAVQSETLENLHEAVAVFGPDGRLRLCNRGFVDLWSLGDVEDKKGGLIDVHVNTITDYARSAFSAKNTKSRNSKKNKLQFLIDLPVYVSTRSQETGRWKTVDDRVIDYAIVPLPDGSSLLTQIDITDSFNIQAALRERSMALEMADRMKSEFIANMAYELRTPLNTIMGFTELLLNGLYGTITIDQTEVLDGIAEAAGNLNRLTTNVLNIAVIDSGSAELSLSEMDVLQVLGDVLKTFTESNQEDSPEIIFDNSQKLPTIKVDVDRITQAFNSLISSAVAICQHQKIINLTVFDNVSENSISVSATLSEVNVNSMEYETIVQAVNVGRNATMKGTGSLDLIVARSMAELHKGKLEIQRHNNYGIEIKMTLPVTYEQ